MTAQTLAWLGASITQTAGPTPTGTNPTSGYRPLTEKWLEGNRTDIAVTGVNAGVGGTGTWYALVRLQADVIAQAPDAIILDLQVNDGTTTKDSASAEALIRRLRLALPNAALMGIFFIQCINYLLDDDTNANATQKAVWVTLFEKYGIPYADYAAEFQALVPGTYHAYDLLGDTVHPTSLGHMIAHEVLRNKMRGGFFGTAQWDGVTLPAREYALSEDYQNTPTITDGTAYDTRSGTWADNGTTISSSTAGSIVRYSATCQSIGINTGDGSTNPAVEISVDGGAYYSTSIAQDGISIGTRAAHTIDIKVVSGTVKIDKFYAI